MAPCTRSQKVGFKDEKGGVIPRPPRGGEAITTEEFNLKDHLFVPEQLQRYQDRDTPLQIVPLTKQEAETANAVAHGFLSW
jgi:hypothetical protein